MRVSRFGNSGRAAVAAFAICGGVALAQQGGMVREMIQKKLAAVKESQAANKAALATYGWTETVEFALKGEDKSTKQFACQYGPDGKIVRTPMGPPPDQQKEGPLRRRIMEKAKEDVEAFMGKVKAVVALYVPPDGQKMEQSFQAGNASLDRPGQGEAGLVFKNYAKPNDSMNLDFNMESKKLASLAVNSYLDDPSQPVTLNVQFAALPDGTSYPAKTVLNAPAKAIQVTMTNSNYQKIR